MQPSGGRFASLLAVGHGVRVSKTEDSAVTADERGRWPIDADELRVRSMDEVARDRSTGESIVGTRSHRFLLNNKSVRLPPT